MECGLRCPPVGWFGAGVRSDGTAGSPNRSIGPRHQVPAGAGRLDGYRPHAIIGLHRPRGRRRRRGGRSLAGTEPTTTCRLTPFGRQGPDTRLLHLLHLLHPPYRAGLRSPAGIPLCDSFASAPLSDTLRGPGAQWGVSWRAGEQARPGSRLLARTSRSPGRRPAPGAGAADDACARAGQAWARFGEWLSDPRPGPPYRTPGPQRDCPRRRGAE
jgi:hypothetical protein